MQGSPRAASTPATAPAKLTRQELQLQKVLRFFTLLFAALAVSYVVQGIVSSAEFPFVANSLAKDGFFAALCAVAVADLRRFSWAVLLVIAGHVLLVVGLVTMAIAGDTSSVAGTFSGPDIPPKALLWGWVGTATGVVALLGFLYRRAQRARYGLRYLGHAEFQTLMALGEVLVLGEDERLTAEEVARNVDEYLEGFEANGKWRIKAALFALTFYPLLRLRPPFPIMPPEARERFVKKRFISDVADRRLPGPIRTLVQAMIRAAQQMVYLGYYGDERGAASVGYVPFSKRPGFEAAMRRVEPDRPRVEVETPRDIDGDRLHADAVVVGSGAAGAIVAYGLAKRGRQVLILERGPHVDPSTFTERETEMLARLYRDGALQLSRDFRFQVLQGMCVGGSTVVNNAVCLDLPERVLRRWNDPDGLDAGMDEQVLRRAFTELRAWLPVHGQAATRLNPGARKFVTGVAKLGLDAPPYRLDIVEANMADCLGSGYCNIGCAFGKKLSMLDRTLPLGQREFGREAFRVLSGCHVERIQRANGRVAGVRCKLSDGRTLRVSANTVVVAAGAIASSLLLRRSRIGGPLVGRNLSFNIASPITADFDDELHSYSGVQISHYLQPPGGDGFMLETWFNPVMEQALFMPGWFDDHYRNMQRYVNMTCAGVVVGSERNGRVRWGLGGLDLRYVPTRGDLAELVDGLKLAGRIFLEAGARRVMPATFRYHEFASAEELARLDRYVKDSSDISVNSAHPQGGNPVSRDVRKGVVDPSFRVHGLQNLYVCDASVFPSSVTVNPQLTVMALARYAADRIE